MKRSYFAKVSKASELYYLSLSENKIGVVERDMYNNKLVEIYFLGKKIGLNLSILKKIF